MSDIMVNGFNINGTPVPYNYDSLGNKLEKTSIARVYDNTSTYSLDEYVIYNGILYRCISEISTAEEWNSEHWLSTSIMVEFVRQKNVKTVNHVNPDIEGNISIFPRHLEYPNTIAGQSVEDVKEALDALVSKKFELPSGGQSGQVLVSNGSGGASWATFEDTSGLPNGDEVSY